MTMGQLFTKHLLSVVIFLPLFGALLLLFFRRPPDEADAHGNEHGEDDAPIATSSAAQAVRAAVQRTNRSLSLVERMICGSRGTAASRSPMARASSRSTSGNASPHTRHVSRAGCNRSHR